MGGATVATSVPVAPGTFFAIIAVSAIAGTAGALLGERRIIVPVVVIELLLGVVIGPHVLGLHVTSFISFISDLGRDDDVRREPVAHGGIRRSCSSR